MLENKSIAGKLDPLRRSGKRIRTVLVNAVKAAPDRSNQWVAIPGIRGVAY
jgi:hypothetical protein